jgi:peroxiredoxin
LHSKQADFTRLDLGLAAISVDEVPTAHAMVTKLGLGYPILSDPAGASLKAFGVFDPDTEIAWPSIFIIGKDGTVVKRWLADTYSQRVATDDVLRDLPPAP